RKAKVALARKLAVTLHAMWRTNTTFREAAMADPNPKQYAELKRDRTRPAGTLSEGEIVPASAARTAHTT
ncbi:hypothetical protein, partial [Sphingobium sp. Ant17]